MFEFVRDSIDHSFDTQQTQITNKASDVLVNGHGICYAKSHLLAAMVRSIGIPAGFCYQKIIFDDQAAELMFILHGLNAIYLESHKKWVRLDPRGNKPGIDVEFSVEKDCLAFPIRSQLGEIDYPKVYTEPNRVIVECLATTSCWNFSAIGQQLPSDLL